MPYFKNFEQLYYAPTNDAYNFKVVTNIFQKSDFIKDILTNSNFLFEYAVKDGERPEDIAFKLYKDSSKHWIVLLTNNIIDPHYDWVLGDRQFKDYINKKYSSYTLYLDPSIEYGVDLAANNILTAQTSSYNKTTGEYTDNSGSTLAGANSIFTSGANVHYYGMFANKPDSVYTYNSGVFSARIDNGVPGLAGTVLTILSNPGRAWGSSNTYKLNLVPGMVISYAGELDLRTPLQTNWISHPITTTSNSNFGTFASNPPQTPYSCRLVECIKKDATGNTNSVGCQWRVDTPQLLHLVDNAAALPNTAPKKIMIPMVHATVPDVLDVRNDLGLFRSLVGFIHSSDGNTSRIKWNSDGWDDLGDIETRTYSEIEEIYPIEYGLDWALEDRYLQINANTVGQHSTIDDSHKIADNPTEYQSKLGLGVGGLCKVLGVTGTTRYDSGTVNWWDIGVDKTPMKITAFGTNAITVPNHRFVSNVKILYETNGNTSIGGLTDKTYYYPKILTNNTIQLCATDGGQILTLNGAQGNSGFTTDATLSQVPPPGTVFRYNGNEIFGNSVGGRMQMAFQLVMKDTVANKYYKFELTNYFRDYGTAITPDNSSESLWSSGASWNRSWLYTPIALPGETIFQGSTISNSKTRGNVINYNTEEGYVKVNIIEQTFNSNDYIRMTSNPDAAYKVIRVECDDNGYEYASNTIIHHRIIETRTNGDLISNTHYIISNNSIGSDKHLYQVSPDTVTNTYSLVDGSELTITKEIEAVSYLKYEYELNEKKRYVKLPRAEFAGLIEQQFIALMSGS